MAVTAAQLAVIRSYCGSDVGADGDTIDLIDVDERLAVLGSAHAVAHQILRQRRADMVMGPAKIDVDGDFSQDATESLKALDRDIATLEAIIGRENGDGVTQTSLMVRRTDRAARGTLPYGCR